MKRMVLTGMALFTLVGGIHAQSLSLEALCHTWRLDKYVIYWISYDPEANEQNDYLELRRDMSYRTVDEGEFSEGRWSVDVEQGSFTLHGPGDVD